MNQNNNTIKINNSRKKVSFRLPIIVCLLSCVLLSSISCLIERSFENFSIQQNVDELNSVVNSIEHELSYLNPISQHNEFIQNLLLILTSHNRLFVYVIDEAGNIIYRTRGPNLAIAQTQIDFNRIVADHSTAIWDLDNFTYRIAASKISVHNKVYTTIVAVSRDFQLEFIKRLHNGLILLIIISSVFALIGTLVTIYFTQKPINTLISKIEMINLQNINYRIPISLVPTKYASLVRAFNNMMHRMQDVFHRQNNFTADIAHEMRTPITNLATQTQIALNSARTTEEYREILYSNLEEYEKMSQMITDMLFLAKADNRQLVPNLINIDLHHLLTMICDYFEPLTDEKSITLKVKGQCLNIQGDKMMLTRAISNIISNAIRYTLAYQQITISLSQLNEKTVRIVISNPGEKIASEHLPYLFDRFYRIDESRQRNRDAAGSGAGIGLAIVKSIIDTHRGTISVESDEQSTRFIIDLLTVIN